jgi:hypothetical protein
LRLFAATANKLCALVAAQKTKAMCRSSAIKPQIETIGARRLGREYRWSTGEDANGASNKRLATPQHLRLVGKHSPSASAKS